MYYELEELLKGAFVVCFKVLSPAVARSD